MGVSGSRGHPVTRDAVGMTEGKAAIKRSAGIYARPIMFTLILLISVAAQAAGMPNGLTPEQKAKVANLQKSVPSGTPPGTAIAEILSCNPYCDRVGEVVLADPAQFEDGLQIQLADPAEKANSESWRFVKHKVSSKKNGKNGELKIVVGGKGAGKEGEEEEDDELNIKHKTPRYWVLHADLGTYFGRRSWNTDSTTLTDVASPFIVGLRYGASFRAPAFLFFEEYSPVFEFGFLARSDLYDKTNSTNPDLSVGMSQSDFTLRTRVYQNEKEMFIQGVVGFNQMKFTAKPQTAGGAYDWTQNSWYLGLIYKREHWELEVDRTISGTVTDLGEASGDRGDSVSGGFTVVRGKYCKNLGVLAKFSIEPCGYLEATFLNQSGTGTPSLPAYTENPTYSSAMWTIGVLVNVYRFLGKPPAWGVERFESMKTGTN